MIVSSIFSVGQQVLILFILISVGFVCAKTKLLQSGAIPGINNLLLYTVTPCVIIESFHREYQPDMLLSLGYAALAAAAAHLINIAAASLLVRDKDNSREAVLRFGTVFSNCGYMALPLQDALLGPEGVFYGATFIAVFNIFNWTYGIFLMGGKEAGFSARKLVLNPGILSVSAGLFFFLTPFSLPQILFTPVRSLAALNTPLPMVIIGYYLSCLPSLRVVFDGKLWLTVFLRLIALPVAQTFLFYFLGLRDALLVSAVVSACAPPAANALVFASKFNRDTELAVTLVAVATAVSILTMPVVVAVSMTLP